MAENLSALELVPRGVEGTGKAVVLGNEPVVQSLARLSGRMDNLAKLKLYAQAKKAEAKTKEVKQEVDRTPYNPEGIASGFMTPVVQSIINPRAQSLVKNWNSLDPETKYKETGDLGMLTKSANNFIVKTDTDVNAEGKTLDALGWNIKPEATEAGRNLYVKEMITKAQADAQAAGITDPAEIQKLAHTNIVSNPNLAVSAFRQAVTSDPNNINLNKFGKRILDNIGKTGYDFIDSDGMRQVINRDNIFTRDGRLNYGVIKKAISADEIDQGMLNLAAVPYLKDAAIKASTPKDLAPLKATEKLISLNYNYDALQPDEKNLIIQKVLPKAQNAVVELMYAGKGTFETAQKLQTTEEEAQGIEYGKMKAGEVSGPGQAGFRVTAGAVEQGPKGAVPALKDGRQVVLPIDVNFGPVDSKQLRPGDAFNFAAGTRFYFTQHVSPTVANLFGKQANDGSYVSEHAFSSNSLDRIKGELYVTNKNAEYKTKKGETFFLPKGVPVNPGQYGGKAVGKNYLIVNVEDYIKTLPERRQQLLKGKADEIKDLRIIVAPGNNSSVLRKFEGTYVTPKKNKSNSSITILKNR